MIKQRKLLLTMHIVTATATVGSSCAGLVVLTGWPASQPVATLGISTRLLALGLASSALAVATGLTVALLSPWGVLKYGWVIKKLGLTLVGLAVMVSLRIWVGLDQGSVRLWHLELGFTVVLVLSLVTTLLSVFKPGGRLRRATRSTPSDSSLLVEGSRR